MSDFKLPMAALVLAKAKQAAKEEGGSDEAASYSDEGYKAAAREMISCLKEGDEAGLANALKNAMDMSLAQREG